MSHNYDIYSFILNAGHGTTRSWNRGDFLCLEGGPLSALYFLVSGKLRVFRTLSSGREIMYRIYTAGSVIGDIEFFTGDDAASCSVQCIERAETVMLPTEALRTASIKEPGLLFMLGRGIARKLHENSVSEALNMFYPLEVRLAHYYLTFTDPKLRAGSLRQLSDWMGCSYRHLTRCLSDLRSRNAVRRSEPGGTGYEAADIPVLESIAAPMLDEEYGRILFEGADSRGK